MGADPVTTYAHVQGDTITLGNPPESFTLPDGTTISNFDQAPPQVLAANGWHPAIITFAALGPTERHGLPVLAFDGTTVTADYPAESQPLEWLNRRTIEAALLQAIADNVAILATVQQGQALINQVATAATTLSTANIANIAAAQTALRGVGTNMGKVATVQAGSITALETSLRQLTKLARLMLGELDATNDA